MSRWVGAGRGPAGWGRRQAALLVVVAGLVAACGGAAGLALTRHPVTKNYGAAVVLPAPTALIAAPSQSQSAPVGEPVSLTIPAIGVQASMVHLGLTSAGELQVPSSTAAAGWYTGSPRPGAVGSAIIAGHIDSYKGPGVFYRLSSLKAGDKVYVKRADGTLAEFRVTKISEYAKDAFPTQAVYGAVPDSELRLITCGGTFDYATGHYLSNTVVYAVQTS
jgi:LPXTG-site transpeptidase (sortase) family protein